MSKDNEQLYFTPATDDTGKQYYIATDSHGYEYHIRNKSEQDCQPAWEFSCQDNIDRDFLFTSKISYPSKDACMKALKEVLNLGSFMDTIVWYNPHTTQLENAIRRDPSHLHSQAKQIWPREIVVMQKFDQCQCEGYSQNEIDFQRGFNAQAIIIQSWDEMPAGFEPLSVEERNEYKEWMDSSA